MKRSYTKEEVREIIQLKNQGVTDRQIGKKFNRTSAAINQVFVELKRFNTGKKSMSGILHKIFEDFRDETFKKPNGGGSLPVSHSVEDNLQKLEDLFKVFQTGLIEVIESEATRRSEDKVKTLKDKYEKELQKMQELLVATKESNVVGFLRKTWLGKS